MESTRDILSIVIGSCTLENLITKMIINSVMRNNDYKR